MNLRSWQRKSQEYTAYLNMILRCYNPKARGYERYGAKGIKVCSKWLQCFANFYSDMGTKPTSKHSLDRIDNKKGYSPENCRWATSKEQSENRRNTIWLEFNGKRMTATSWAKEVGLPVTSVYTRIANGWSPERVLSKDKPNSDIVMQYLGVTDTASRWAKKLGLNKQTILMRLRRGWTHEQALSRKPLKGARP